VKTIFLPTLNIQTPFLYQKIRVAYIIGSLNRIAGSERHLLYLLDGLSDCTESVVFCLFQSGVIADKIIRKPTLFYHIDMKDFSFISIIKSTLQIAKKISKKRVDIVHAHGFAPSLIGGLSSRIAGIPFISARREMANWRKYKHFAAYGLINFLADAITVNSIAVADITSKECFAKRKIQLIRNGVALQKHCPDKNSAPLPPNPHNGRVVGTVANYRPIKNYNMIINAVPEILKVFPDTVFWFIGEGSDRNRLERKINQLGIEDNVFLTGTRQDISSLLNQMDVFVLTSFAEGSPNSVLEAVAHGLPVVATNVGGLPEIVLNDKTGFLVPIDSSRLLAEKLIYLLSNYENAKAMGANGRKHVENNFALDRLLKEQLNLYLKTLKYRRNNFIDNHGN
jgi:glycosyltransferase involved in cell wall biosynthesis